MPRNRRLALRLREAGMMSQGMDWRFNHFRRDL